MSINSHNVAGRRAKAISLIKSGLIHSQTDLVLHLKKSGFRVTQATASRDLVKGVELNLFSKSGMHNKTIYKIK